MVHTFLSICCVVGVAKHASASRDTPVQKVLVMLDDMRVKSEKAAADEEKIYGHYTKLVDSESKRLDFEIKEGQKHIERFGALLAKADSNVDNLGRHAEEIQDDITRMENSMRDAKSMRSEENSGFLRVSRDYKDSMDALSKAIEMLKSQTLDHPQALMLLQKLAVKIPSAKDAVTGFAQDSLGDDTDSAGASVAADPSRLDSLLTMLEQLQDKFTEQLQDASTDEATRRQHFDVTLLHLSNSLKESNGALAQKIAGKARAATVAAAMQGKVAAAQHELDANEKFFADMKAAYEAKSAVFAQNQKFRAEEVKVLKMATDIISSPGVADSYGGHVNLAKVSFLQVGSSDAKSVRAERVAAYLQRQGEALSSSSLSSLAARIMRNPFFRVIHLIEALLNQMHLESQQQAEHKAWCDEQLHATKEKSQRKMTQIQQLSAENNALQSQIDEMAKAIQELTREQLQLTKAMQAATSARQKEKAENEAAISDSQAGDYAVKQALMLLEEFYSTQATSLVQLVPATHPDDIEDNYASHRLYMGPDGLGGASGSVSGGVSDGTSDTLGGVLGGVSSGFSGGASGGSSGGSSYSASSGSSGGSSGGSLRGSGGSLGGSFGGNSVGATLASNGVISLLEVIASDFVRVAADTSTAEHQAVLEYEAFMHDAKEDSEAKHALEVKTKLDKDQTEFQMNQSQDDYDSMSEELAKAKDYLGELLSQCVHSNIDYQEREATRNAEIKALKEAYKMLEDHS